MSRISRHRGVGGWVDGGRLFCNLVEESEVVHLHAK
jgi:hypothetical protein